MKNYTTKSAAAAAIKKQGLHLVEHELSNVNGKFVPVFRHWLIEDVREIISRGFECRFDPRCEPEN